MPKLSDRVPENRFVALFVSRSGCGKTVAAASFDKPMQVEEFDGRIGGAQVSWQSTAGIDYEYYPPKTPGLVTKLNDRLDKLITAAKLQSSSQGISIELPKTHLTDSLTNMTYAFVCQAIPLTHPSKDKGRWLGVTAMPGPTDYGLEAQATYDYIACLKSLPIKNLIITAHWVDRYGKPPDVDNDYADSVVIGKKLSVRDKIGENIQTHFDHIFEFERSNDRFYVTFRGDFARTSYDWLPSGRHEWTKKNFQQFMMSFKEGEKK